MMTIPRHVGKGAVFWRLLLETWSNAMSILGWVRNGGFCQDS